MTTKFPDDDLGVSKIDRGYMIVCPPSEEAVRRLFARELPFTSRRIVILETSHYFPDGQAGAYATLFAAAPKLLAALRDALWMIEAQEGTSDANDKIVDAARAAIKEAVRPTA